MPNRGDRPPRVAPNWIKGGSGSPSIAANPTLPRAFSFDLTQTDQYMDPWKDLELSTDPLTRDRHAYAGNNPIGYVDRDGHRPACEGAGACGGGRPLDPSQPGSHDSTNDGGSGDGGGSGGGGGGAGSTGGGSVSIDLGWGTVSIPYAPPVAVHSGTAEISLEFAALAQGKGPIYTPEMRARDAAFADAYKNGVTSERAGVVLGDLGRVAKLMNDAADASMAMEGTTCWVGCEGIVLLPFSLGLRGGARAGGRMVSESVEEAATRGIASTCSFPGSVLVLMADGTRKTIQLVQVGDMVLAANFKLDEPVARRVTHVWVHGDDFVNLTTDGGVVTTTWTHPFYNAETGKYQPAGTLRAGDELSSASGDRLTVWGVSGRVGHGDAYNLTVDDRHTYYVGVGMSGSALVHNRGCEIHAQQLQDVMPGSTIIRARTPGPHPTFDAKLPNNKADRGWGYHDYVVDANGRAWDADTPGMPRNEYEGLFPDWVTHDPL